MDPNQVLVEAELSPGAIEQWILMVKDGKKSLKGNRRSDLSMKVKKHLSALGWVFSYAYKGKKRELRYKSPNGKCFYSLATACISCLDQDSSHQQQEQQIVPIYDLPPSPRNLCSESGFDVSNQKQRTKKKNKKRGDLDVNGADPEKENHSSDVIRIVLNVDVSNQQHKKRRRLRLKKILHKKIREKESLRFWRRDCGPDMNSDVCCLCHYGGDLLLCDGCPSAFHLTCLSLSSLPKEDLWFCSSCSCGICGAKESPENSKLMSCEQCRRRFHLKCLKAEPGIVSCSGWFCSSQCSRVFSALQELLRCKIAVGEDGDLVWTLMRAPIKDEHFDDEQMSKLNSAVEILHQGFEPSKDPFSGKDLVEELIFRRGGFYTVLIERKNELVSVAVVRVEKDVVEIPLVATSESYRRSGMCRLLMDELEMQMSQMGVCRLVLPAAKEVVTTWTQRFGFSVMENTERLELVKHGTLDFLGTVMCHKFLLMETGDKDSAEESSLT